MTSPSGTPKSLVTALTRINLDDFVAAIGWQDRPLAARAARLLFWRPARRFAGQIAELDAAAAARGLPEAAQRAIGYYVRSLHVEGGELLPSGPYLALSNHPGTVDTLALFAALRRPDLKIIASARPFLRALPNVATHLLFVDDVHTSALNLVREGIRHLRSGGSLLTFPAGSIEPDPDVHADAVASLAQWTEAEEVFARAVPDLWIVPTVVRGVVWARAARSPLATSRATRAEQDGVAAALQAILQMTLGLRPLTVRVQFGNPISAQERPAGLHTRVLHEMSRLIQAPVGPTAVRLV